MILQRLMRNERGGVLIFMALALGLLITSMGIAIDMGRVFLVRSKTQTSLDAAVISAAAVLRTGDDAQNDADIQKRGKEFFDVNFPDGYMGVANPSDNIQFQADRENGTLRGDINLTMNTVFGDLIGALFPEGSDISTVKMDVFSETQRIIAARRLEIGLVLDHTASMCTNAGGAFNRGACNVNQGKFKAMQDSVGNLVRDINTAVEAVVGEVDVYYSYIPFVHTVRVNGVAEHDNTAVSGISETLAFLPNIRGLTEKDNAWNIFNTRMNSAKSQIGEIGGTNTAVGTLWGWRSLRANDAGRFAGDSRHDEAPNPVNAEDTFKVMIVMTDGQNQFMHMGETQPEPKHDFGADAQQAAYCEGAKGEGIDLYTVVFMEDDAAANAMMKACATSASKYFKADSPQELEDAFAEIVENLIDLRITK